MVEHLIIYRNENSYSAFPDVERLHNGELVVIFREAKRRNEITHLDSTSQASLVRSTDGGQSWSAATPVAVDHPDIGIQDPSIVQLSDGTLLANFFRWKVRREEPYAYGADGIGVYVVRSTDNGHTWSKDFTSVGLPPGIGEWLSTTDAILELSNGELLIPVYENNVAPGELGGHRALVMRSGEFNASVTSQHLQQILDAFPQRPILLLWDRAPWHRGEPIRELLASNSRLELMEFPVAAPELNPQEQVWKQTRRVVSHNHLMPRLPELADRFENHLTSHTFASSFLDRYGYHLVCPFMN